jgi:hypothetical protein
LSENVYPNVSLPGRDYVINQLSPFPGDAQFESSPGVLKRILLGQDIHSWLLTLAYGDLGEVLA